jgi:Transposase DDE domain
VKENKIVLKLQALVSLFLPYCNLKEYIKTTGRKLALPIIETLSLSLFWHLQGIVTKKSVYDLLSLKSFCSYNRFVVNVNRLAPIALQIIALVLKHNRKFAHIIKHTDSTDIPVCLMKNVDHHKTMKDVAALSKNSKGWYYGLQLHLTRDFMGKSLALRITTADASVRDTAKAMNQDLWGVIILDSGYVKEELQNEMNVEGKRWWLVKPYKSMKKLATIFENLLYDTRMMIESAFRNLKLFLGLVSSMPRSVGGYLANYVYAILALFFKPMLEQPLLALN